MIQRGKSDEEFETIIKQIEEKILHLKSLFQNGIM